MRWLLLVGLVVPSLAFGFYSPKVARWTTPDPIEEEGGKNLYAYCRNSPLCCYDPLGENIYLYQGNDSGKWWNDKFHQAVAVDEWSTDCPRTKVGVVGFSFGYIGEWGWNWPNGKWLGMSGITLPGFVMIGEIYEVGNPPGNVVRVKETTPEQDRAWLEMMRNKTGVRDVYSVGRHNCRSFAQREFDAAP